MIRVMQRSSRAATLAAAMMVVVGCSAVTPSTTPPPSATASSVPSSTATPVPSTAAPSPSPTPSPTPSPSPTPVPTPCAIIPQNGTLPSDRLLDVKATSSAGFDVLTFFFGKPSLPGPGGIPKGELSLAEPPYTFGPSGKPITMEGDRVLQVVFRQMSLAADTGDPVYTGPAELKPELAVLRHAVEYDESEGVIGWYIGFDGPNCPTLTKVGNNEELAFKSP